MVLNEQSNTKERVVLELLGIDKKWVRSKDGTWVDLATLPKKQEVEEHEGFSEKRAAKRKWWKFW